MTFPLPNPSQPDSQVIRTLRDYRARMDGLEAATMQDMARRWLEIERKLDADIVALAYEFERRARAGEVITEQMIRKAARYKALKLRLADEIRKYNKDYAIGAISTAQAQMAALGIEAAQGAILASLPGAPALSSVWNRINVGAVQSLIGFAGDGSPLYSLLKNDYPDAVDGIISAMVNGLARGLGPAQIAEAMSTGMGLGLDRAMLIARTEAARAYRTGSTEQYRASGVVSGFRRLVKKETACAACLFLDGELFDTADELDDHPRGKCMAVPVVIGAPVPKWQTGKEWFMLQSESRQREILGPQKYQLWQDEEFALDRFAQHSHSDVWGDAPRVATIAELTE